jgi:hypothetical protein
MVFGFILQSLDKEKEPFVCVSVFYNKEGNDIKKKDREQRIVRAVHKDFQFQSRCADSLTSLMKPTAASAGRSTKSVEAYAFALSASPPPRVLPTVRFLVGCRQPSGKRTG